MTTVFVASNIPTNYPYKLQKPATLNPTVRATAEEFIMDSGIGDDVTNEEVLDLAHEHRADYVVAKDYLHDKDRTTASIKEFAGLYAGHACDSTVMVPLQPDHATHYGQLPELPFNHFVLGGMATPDVSDDDVVRYIKRFRRVAPDVYCHALGVGGGRALLSRLHGTGLVDSIDCATPELAAACGEVLDSDLRRIQVRIMSGEGARKRNLPLAEFNSWQIHDAWNGGREVAGQASMDAFGVTE